MGGKRILAWGVAFAVATATAGFARAFAPAADVVPPETLELQSRSSLRHYDYDNGLPQASVNAIVRTHDGFLWLGTFGGLVRFDGREFRVFRSAAANAGGGGDDSDGPSSERILSLYEDARHRLWIGTQEGGVDLYENGRFRHLPVCGGTCQVNRLFSLDGRDVWMVGANGVFRVDQDSLTATAHQGLYEAYALAAVAGGKAFLGGLLGLARVSSEGIERVPLPDAHTTVLNIVSDGASVWVVVENGILYRYDVADERWTLIRKGLLQGVHLITDGTGHVYVSDEIAGTRLLARDGAERPVEGLERLKVSNAYVDVDGTMWIGSPSKGLWRRRPALVSLLRSTTALNSPGRVVTADGAGGVWLAHGCASLWHLGADGRQTEWPVRPALKDECVVSLSHDAESGVLWMGSTGSRLARLQGGRLEAIAAWPRSAEVSVWQTNDGQRWIGSAHFVARLRLDEDGSFADIQEVPALAGMSVKQVVDARAGGVWIVGDRGAFRVVGDQVVERWTSAEGIRGGYFRALHEDADGVLWIGTYGNGLVRVERGVVQQFTEANGLFDDTVSCILPDAGGHLWMAGNRGISVLLDRRIGADGPRILTLSASDGLDPPEFNGGTAPPCTQDGAGRLWFAMVVGFAMVDPASLDPTESQRVPAAYIDHVATSQRSFDPWGPIDLDVNAANLEIGFGAIDLIDPDKVRFRYRLGEAGGEWIDAGSNRSVLLPMVPWGELRFEVQARELGGRWSPAATLRLNRPIPWYRHQWIWLAASLASLLALLWMTREHRRPDLDDALLARLRKNLP